MTMEIVSIDVVFFKAIGLIWLWKLLGKMSKLPAGFDWTIKWLNLFIMFLIKHRIISVSFYKIISLEHHFRGKCAENDIFASWYFKIIMFCSLFKKIISYDLDIFWSWQSLTMIRQNNHFFAFSFSLT